MSVKVALSGWRSEVCFAKGTGELRKMLAELAVCEVLSVTEEAAFFGEEGVE